MQETGRKDSTNPSGEAQIVSDMPTPHSEVVEDNSRDGGRGARQDIQEETRLRSRENQSSIRKRQMTREQHKPYLAIHTDKIEIEVPVKAEAIYVITGKELKEFVRTIEDDVQICYIDVGEGKHLVLRQLLAGVIIEGKK